MRRFAPQWTVVALALCLLAVGCADPAKGKPQAEVKDAAPASAAAPSDAGTAYYFAEGSSIEWVGSKVTGAHDGGFREFDGEIRLVDGNPELSSVSVQIDTTSIWSDDDRLTGHLMSADFFEVEAYPEARFDSTSIVAEGDAYAIVGNLDLHGVEKSIRFPAEIVVEPGQVTASAEFAIKRFDFGIVYKGHADDLIRDDVVIKLNLIARADG